MAILCKAAETILTKSPVKELADRPGAVSDDQALQSMYTAAAPLTLPDTVTDQSVVHQIKFLL